LVGAWSTVGGIVVVVIGVVGGGGVLTKEVGND